MIRTSSLMIGLCCLLLGAGDAGAVRLHFWSFDLTARSSSPWVGEGAWRNCGLEIDSSDELWSNPGFGLGVMGGVDAGIDGNEWIDVELQDGELSPRARRGVRYFVEATDDASSNGIRGETLVEAFDGDLRSLGILAISGPGEKDLSALFGGEAIRRFRLTARGDGVRLRYIEYDSRPGDAVEAELKWFAEQPSVEICDVTVLGSSSLRSHFLLGAGVEGGRDVEVDGDEFVLFHFPGPVRGVELGAGWARDNTFDGVRGEGVVEAFGEDGSSLGELAVDSSGAGFVLDMEDLYGPVPITSVFYQARGDGRTIASIRYAPEPSAALLSLAAVLTIGGIATRRSRSSIATGRA